VPHIYTDSFREAPARAEAWHDDDGYYLRITLGQCAEAPALYLSRLTKSDAEAILAALRTALEESERVDKDSRKELAEALDGQALAEGYAHLDKLTEALKDVQF
jgi:hypothetical protein